jgi:signal transduction histidine kinase
MKIFSVLTTVLINLTNVTVIAQIDTLQTLISDTALHQMKVQAEQHFEAFRNGPAFDALVQYGKARHQKWMDSVQKHLNRTILLYSDSLVREHNRLIQLQARADAMKHEDRQLKAERNRLLRNAGLYVILIATSAGLFLFFLKRRRQQEETLSNRTWQSLQSIEEYNRRTESIRKVSEDLRFSFHSIAGLSSELLDTNEKLRAMCVTLNVRFDEFESISDNILHIHTVATRAVDSIDHFNSFFSDRERVKQSGNLNPLLADMAQLALLWVQSEFPGFQCRIHTDLEKILPDMEMQPYLLRIAFFHLLCNAFETVAVKSMQASADFVPQVTVTSRKLPRFLQVRIRDNGQGISLKDTSRLFEPFVTLSHRPVNTGLGLYHAARILKEGFKAEILVESDFGSGTNVLIRFPFVR